MNPWWYAPIVIALDGYVVVVCVLFLVLYHPVRWRLTLGAFMMRSFAVAVGYPALRMLWRLLFSGIRPEFVNMVDVASALVTPVLYAVAITLAIATVWDDRRRHRSRKVASHPSESVT